MKWKIWLKEIHYQFKTYDTLLKYAIRMSKHPMKLIHIFFFSVLDKLMLLNHLHLFLFPCKNMIPPLKPLKPFNLLSSWPMNKLIGRMKLAIQFCITQPGLATYIWLDIYLKMPNLLLKLWMIKEPLPSLWQLLQHRWFFSDVKKMRNSNLIYCTLAIKTRGLYSLNPLLNVKNVF